MWENRTFVYAGEAAGAKALCAGPVAFFFAICGCILKGLAMPGACRCGTDGLTAVPCTTDGGGATALYC